MFCPECGTENRTIARFCKGCGLRFDDDPTSTEAASSDVVSPFEQTIAIQPNKPRSGMTTTVANPSFKDSTDENPLIFGAPPTPPQAPPTPSVGGQTAIFGGGPSTGFGETSSPALVFGDEQPFVAPPTVMLPPPDEPILFLGQDDLAPPTVPNTPFSFNPNEPATVPNRPPAIPPTVFSAPVPPPIMPPAPPVVPPTMINAAVPPPFPPTVVSPAVPPPQPMEPPSAFAGVMPLRSDPAPGLPPEVAAQPFRPIAPPGGTPRPMGQSRATEAAPSTKPPVDLFAAPTPVASGQPKKSKTPLILGLLAGVGVLFLLLGGIGFVAYQRFAKPKPVPEPVKTNPTDPTDPTGTTPPPAPVAPADMIAIPGGEYMIGRNDGDLLDKYEKPQHPVTLQAFYIDKTEVTNAEYKKFVDATGHAPATSWVNGQIKPGTEYFPVTGVSFDDAEAYAKWAGKRLPTEEEWEAAAHGRTPALFPWGNEQDFSRMNIKPSGIDGPVRVGANPAGASPFGVLDMAGNVWEWTASEAAPYPGSTEPIAPDSTGKKQIVIRGGAFNETPKRSTTTFRNWVPFDLKVKELGFRCVKSQ